MEILILILVAINIAFAAFIYFKLGKADNSQLQTQLAAEILNGIRPLTEKTTDKIVQLETVTVQKFENQKEVTKLQVSEIIEDKFKKIATEQNKTSQDIIEKFGNFQHALGQQLVGMNEKITKDMQDKLNEISNSVRENLDQGFKKTNETFNSVIERLAKIDEAQKKIESLSSNVVSLQDVLTDKKSRGIFGEVQLNQILSSVFGEKNDAVYQLQYKLSNGTQCDSILFLPGKMGNIVIDSKFPLENYRRMIDLNFTEVERADFTREFKSNVKKHIDDIAKKYIIEGETSDQAILFLPAEAIFAEINAYHHDIISYAQNKRVWLVSPTTFMATLTTIQVVLQEVERSKYTNIIHEELKKLGTEFVRYKDRWDKLAKHIDNVSQDVKDIHTTTEKITNRFESISTVKMDHLIDG